MLFYVLIGLFIWAVCYGAYLGWTEDDRKKKAEEELRRAIMNGVKLEMGLGTGDDEDDEE